ncbi:hypothetical protein Tcur_0868 [Thermomonospora curvata DSM 43183]|uniref:Uncharacterized protein n=1 Tax=Thermomonospora curvata (strain ATCC 19995 / DSM 43183 / JCM 3096 / KCTC 9072 / NBRC 15933 / NCIMB 10081 / Henssen B9) TaxID=471852 RepID=D1A6I3_THECD|nr:hypothetical protein Tcur_0868 [Thermomonospora curvata DSM 43183]
MTRFDRLTCHRRSIGPTIDTMDGPPRPKRPEPTSETTAQGTPRASAAPDASAPPEAAQDWAPVTGDSPPSPPPERPAEPGPLDDRDLSQLHASSPLQDWLESSPEPAATSPEEAPRRHSHTPPHGSETGSSGEASGPASPGNLSAGLSRGTSEPGSPVPSRGLSAEPVETSPEPRSDAPPHGSEAGPSDEVSDPASPGGPSTEPAGTAPEAEPSEPGPYAPLRGLSAEPTAQTPKQVTPAEAESGLDPLLPGEFIRSFAATVTWKAMLVVADGAFPGLGVAAALIGRIGELLGAVFLPSGGDGGAPFPVWTGEQGLVLDLSTRSAGAGRLLGDPAYGAADRREPGWTALGVEAGRAAPSGFRQRHHGVLVIDTLNPQSLYRPFGGPAQPDRDPADRTDAAVAAPDGGPDAGVVIVADVSRTGRRVVTAGSLWRHACRTVTWALYDPARPESWPQTRAELRALRHVGYIDPALGLALVLYVDAARRPWCPLGFLVEEDATTGRASIRMLWP